MFAFLVRNLVHLQFMKILLMHPKCEKKCGLLGIAPTLNCTHFLKIGCVVAGGGFYSYYIHQGNKSDKKGKKVKFYA